VFEQTGRATFELEFSKDLGCLVRLAAMKLSNTQDGMVEQIW